MTIMSPSAFALLLVLIGLLWSMVHRRRRQNSEQKLPPGPKGLPIIGNLHMLGNLPHRSLQDLAKKHGPIMFLRLGKIPTIVVSSPEAAELFLKTYDNVFSSRPKVQFSKYMSYGGKGMAFTPYGSYWRNAKKFCMQELLSPAKVDSFSGMRKEELSRLVKELREAAAAREVVDVTVKVTELIKNTICRMLFGRSDDDRFDLKDIVHEAMELAGAFNIADFLPFLGPLDLQGLTRRLNKSSKILDELFDMIIEEHEQDKSDNIDLRNSQNKDFVDIMLSAKKNSKDDTTNDFLTDRTNVKGVLFDMIAGAVDTSHNTVEWALSELIRHPSVMKKLREELNQIVGSDRMVEETDLSKLKYLDMVIKETFRLYPVAPLMVPHESMEDIVINGSYYIPKKSRIIVNTWALGRDSNVWSENAEQFVPERFRGSNVDVLGHDFELLPFGSGRRWCPGMHLGLVSVRLVVAQLVHCFDWDLPSGMSTADLNMTEKFGLAIRRSKNLLALPTYRLKTAKI